MPSTAQERHLLILDDDPNIVKALTRLLSGEGYCVHGFSRPLDALHMLEEGPAVDVIISDLCMPQMDGREFLRRAASLCPKAIPITLSGYVEEEQALAGNGRRVWRALEKPWQDSELKHVLAEAFAARSAMDRGATVSVLPM